MKKLFIACFVLVGLLSNRSAFAQNGQIVFYEGNNATQKAIYQFKDVPIVTRLYPNDEARSLALIAVHAGAVITVYDSKDLHSSDDYCVIRVKRQIATRYVVSSFETSYEDDDVQVTYYRKNGLDGKVSSMSIN